MRAAPLLGLVLGLLPGQEAGPLVGPGGGAPAPPVELGRVAWGRDLDAGLAEAARVDRPLLLLFQEVPG